MLMRRNSAEITGTACIVTIGSNTQAMRAKKALASFGIPASVRKTERGGRNSKGCSFGVSYPCLYQASVATILQNAGIAVTEFRNDR